MLNETDIIIRFFASAIIGMIIGLARRGKSAGARTFALISLGSTIFTVVSFAPLLSSYVVDPTRIVGQIVAGIGFLGLGVIWRQGPGKPAGLTTAATIWVAAAIGVLTGLGMWMELLTGTALTLVILFLKAPLQKAKLD